jgi:hypothetical protein
MQAESKYFLVVNNNRFNDYVIPLHYYLIEDSPNKECLIEPKFKLSKSNCLQVIQQENSYNTREFLENYFKSNPPIKFENQTNSNVHIGLESIELERLLLNFLSDTKTVNKRIPVNIKKRSKNIDELREENKGFLNNSDLWVIDTDENDCVILELAPEQ